jgi:hypothetical protein
MIALAAMIGQNEMTVIVRKGLHALSVTATNALAAMTATATTVAVTGTAILVTANQSAKENANASQNEKENAILDVLKMLQSAVNLPQKNSKITPKKKNVSTLSWTVSSKGKVSSK